LKAKTQLQQYGITPTNVRSLRDTPTPALLNYLDLVEPRREHVLLPDGVAETMGRPLLFFLDESQPSVSVDPFTHERNLADLRRRILASRGERVYLARILPGELRVVPVSLAERTPEWKVFYEGTGEASIFFSRLALGKFDGQGEPETPDFLFKEMFELLMHGADDLGQKLDRADVLSLIGRALFFRFLHDRRILKDEDLPKIAPKSLDLLSCFDNSQNAASTSRWLDITFNGDFLPLTDDGNQAFFDRIGRKTDGTVFTHLSAILRGGKPIASAHYQLRFDWGDFDFAHVPVGLLSQVYEAFCWKWEHGTARDTSVYYTPRNIAATIVDETFDKVPNAATSRLLDPACGAGVFLVLAFRRIYRERWELTSQRPDTKAIREILDKQLTGFDISESALRLSALSLYLTAIELDPKPVPPEKLRFKKLRGTSLFNFRRADEPAEGVVIGSLGSHVGTRFDGKFDLVLSNPPWTSLPKAQSKLALELEKASKAVISRKCEKLAQEYRNPDNAPDLPFLWKSTEWCKPSGRIAMALPARLLLKQEEIPRHARETVFRLIEITGIVNGSNLSDTKVWPEMQQPFMLLFARNRQPKVNHIVRFITPYCDTLLNRRGEVRIDSKSVQPVEIDAAFRDPWLWKTLTVGTSLDVEVIRRIREAKGNSLAVYWTHDLGLVSSTGYKVEAHQPQKDASFLHGLPDFHSARQAHFVVETGRLERFMRPTLNRTRSREVYAGPLVLVKESPGMRREKGWAFLCFPDVAYDQSFYGYSAGNNREGKLLVRYLHLFVHSIVWLHYALLTSPKLGAERRTIYKSDLDDCPMVPLERLTAVQKRKLQHLSERLTRADTTVFVEIDDFFGDLYGLDELDLEVIRDTLKVCLPYDESRQRACQPPSALELDDFRRRLESLLTPFFKVLGTEPAITPWEPRDDYPALDAPFSVLLVGKRGHPLSLPEGLLEDKILPLSNETGATRIILQVEGGLAVGVLNQYRYWTPSRARLLSAEILRQYGGLFEK